MKSKGVAARGLLLAACAACTLATTTTATTAQQAAPPADAPQPLIGLNASGQASSLATLEKFQQQGLDRVPIHGPLSVTVPGAVRHRQPPDPAARRARGHAERAVTQFACHACP